jgi:hypothetical protein
MAFHSLKYTYIGKKVFEANQCGSGSETLSVSLQICIFAICGLGQQGNLWFCYLRINHYKFSDLRFADWHTSEMCRFALAELAQEFVDLRFAD